MTVGNTCAYDEDQQDGSALLVKKRGTVVDLMARTASAFIRM